MLGKQLKKAFNIIYDYAWNATTMVVSVSMIVCDEAFLSTLVKSHIKISNSCTKTCTPHQKMGFKRNMSYFKKNTAKSGHPVSRCLKSKPEMLPNNGSKFHHNLVLIRLPMILDLTNNSEPSYILLLMLWCNPMVSRALAFSFHFTTFKMGC